MTITLYSGFTKRPNSTKQPTSGTDATVVLKDPEDIYNPSFRLSGGLSTYENVTAVKWGSRYYFVTGITSNHNGVTTISCTLDRGATYKTAIGSTNAFIERCATGYNMNIADDSLSMLGTNYMQAADSGAILPATTDYGGMVCLQVASTDTCNIAGGGVAAYWFDPARTGITGPHIYDVIAKLWSSNTVYDDLKKVLGDAWSTIIKATFIPYFTAKDLKDTTYFEDEKATLGTVYYNDVPVVRLKPGAGIGRTYAHTYSYVFNLASMMKYNTFTWRNKAPFAKWKMYLPFFGEVDIPIEEYIDDGGTGKMPIKFMVDVVTGDAVYMRYKRVDLGGGSYVDYEMARYNTSIGIDIPLSNIKSGNKAAAFGSLVQAGINAAAGNYAGAAGSIIEGAKQAFQNSVSSTGAMTTGISTCRIEGLQPIIRVYQIGYETLNSPAQYVSSIGAPFMAQDLISNHSGFIKCVNASVQMAGTQDDKNAVNAMLDSGFFYE